MPDCTGTVPEFVTVLTKWSDAVAAFDATAATVAATPTGEDIPDDVMTRHDEAIAALFELPAPDLTAASYKLRLLAKEFHGRNGADHPVWGDRGLDETAALQRIIADVDRLMPPGDLSVLDALVLPSPRPADAGDFEALFHAWKETDTRLSLVQWVNDKIAWKQRGCEPTTEEVTEYNAALKAEHTAYNAILDYTPHTLAELSAKAQLFNEDDIFHFDAVSALSFITSDITRMAEEVIDFRAARLVVREPSDAELLSLGIELERRFALEQSILSTATDEELDAACEYTGEIAHRIMALPAHTLDGYRVKAWAVRWCFDGGKIDFDDTSTACVFSASLINDLLDQPAGAASQQLDAELVALGARYAELDAELMDHIGKHCGPRTDEYYERSNQLTDALDPLINRSFQLRATTLQGMRAKAQIADAWQPTDGTVEYDELPWMVVRSLISDALALTPDVEPDPRIQRIEALEADLLARVLANREMPYENADDYKVYDAAVASTWEVIGQIVAAPCDSFTAVRAKLRVALDRIVRNGGSDWKDKGDEVVLEQAIAFLEQAA